MHRLLLPLAALAILSAGCRNQNPYAMFGPSTVPPPNMAAPPPAGYYPPPAAPPGSPATTIPGAIPADMKPSFGSVPTNSLPTASLLPVPPKPSGELSPASLPAKPAATTAFASRDNFASEAPIRIVEAAPSASSSSRVASSVLPFREAAPPTVVQASPAVPFNASGSAAEVSTLPRPGIHAPTTPAPAIPAVPLNKTRGFIPAQPSGAGSFRTDTSVKPAGYVEAIPSAAAGQWRAR